jgi:hypothetical protein
MAPARLSQNTQLALNQLEAQSDQRHQLLALLLRNGIADGALQIASSQGTEAHYKQKVDAPSPSSAAGARQAGDLTVRTKLNEQFAYDILSIELHVPSSGATASVHFPSSPPAAVRESEPPHIGAIRKFSNLSALNSQSRFIQISANSENVSASLTTMQAKHNRTPSVLSTNFLNSKEPIFAIGKSTEQPVAGLEHAEKTPTKKALSQRQYSQQRVPDPENPGKTTTRNVLTQRKCRRKDIPDPDNPGDIISQDVLSNRKRDLDRVQDPENPGEFIRKDTLYQKTKVADPKYPGQLITRTKLSKRTSRERQENALNK